MFLALAFVVYSSLSNDDGYMFIVVIQNCLRLICLQQPLPYHIATLLISTPFRFQSPPITLKLLILFQPKIFKCANFVVPLQSQNKYYHI